MADLEYTTKIKTEGDPSGAAKVKEALDQASRASGNATSAAQRQGEQAKSTARSLNELGEAGEKGAAAGRNLAAVLEGNTGALAMLGTQLKAVGAVVRANPFGGLFVVLTAGLALLPTLIGKFREMKDATGEAGKAAEENAPKFKALADAMEKAGNAQSEALTASLTAIKTEAKGAADELERVLRLRADIDRLNTSAAQAQVDADPTLTPEEKKRRRAEIEQKEVDRQRARDDEKLGADYAAALATRDRTRAELERARDVEGGFRGAVDADAAARARRTELQNELAGLQRQPGGTSPEAMARGERMQQINRELEGMRSLDDPATKQFIEEQRKRALRARADVEKTQKEADAAEESLRLIGRDVVGITPDGRAIRDPQTAKSRGLEDRMRRQAAGIPEPKSQIAPGPLMDIPAAPPAGPDRTPTVRDGRSMRGDGTGPVKNALSPETARIIQELRDWNRAAQENADATMSELRAIVEEIRRNREVTQIHGEQIKGLRR